MEHQTAVKNRARYTLLNDRRRGLFELHKLTEAVHTHERYAAATVAFPGLTGVVDDCFARTSGELCGQACQADLNVLERDLVLVYTSLAELSRVWVGLEDEGDLEPLVAAYYEL